MQRILYKIIFLGLLSVIGCAPVISKQIREQVRPDITFKDVLQDPDRYKDQVVIFSGIIIDSKNTKEGTLLTVLQRPADHLGKPKDTDETGGRFLALDSRFQDVSVFTAGRAVTVGGIVLGKRTLPLGEIQYTYPLIYVKEIYLWPEEKYTPYPYPYPYYYPYGYWPGEPFIIIRQKKGHSDKK